MAEIQEEKIPKEYDAVLRSIRNNLEGMEKILRKYERNLLEIRKDHEEMKKTIRNSLKKNEDIDETLCNVLLAIRQNEYLQAWYPAQKGFPEMKVVGKHPLNIKK